jgi:uncharacterized protein
MQHIQAKATATPTTDRGEFEAIVATWDRDRVGDTILPGAFKRSLEEWQTMAAITGRKMPLHFNHVADEIIGEVDPISMIETVAGLQVAGKIDLDTERGREVWRQLKANRVGFSFGYMARKTRDQPDGRGQVLADLDIFEITITPAPANNATRVLSTKGFGERELAGVPIALIPTEEELFARMARIEREC